MAENNRTLLWCIYYDFKDGKEHAFEFTKEEKKIPIENVLKNNVDEYALFLTMQIAFNEKEAIRKRPRL